jgi:predicted CXXCH cytochrome family protein
MQQSSAPTSDQKKQNNGNGRPPGSVAHRCCGGGVDSRIAPSTNTRRSRTTIALAIVPVVLIIVAIAGLDPPIAVAEIAGSKHDLRHHAWSKADLCGTCHTPHRENPPAAAPVWDTNADLNQRFGTANDQMTIAAEGTQMCIRCHDGTVAKDTIGGIAQGRSNLASSNRAARPGFSIAGHGSTDHPVGVPYPKLDKGYQPEVVLQSKNVVRVPGGRVECTSCHDPHNTAGHKDMLVMSNAGSALCLSCHKK